MTIFSILIPGIPVIAAAALMAALSLASLIDLESAREQRLYR